MTGKPTEKMVGFLKGKGIDASNMSFEDASNLIGQLKNGKTITEPKIEFPEKRQYQKPSYNPSSQYVSYSKDIFLALREMIHVEVMKPSSKMDVVADEQIMARAIQLVKIAINEFE